MTWLLAFILVQDVRSQADRVRAAMAVSLAQQRLSVRHQAESARVAVTPWAAAATPDCDPIPKPQLTRMVDDAARRQGVDPALVLEVARQESGFYPCAVSAKGAEGLMQLMPSTQVQFQMGDPFDAKENLEAGAKLLKQLLERYHGDLSMALGAYNAGAGRVDKAGGIPEIPETKNYILSILSRLP